MKLILLRGLAVNLLLVGLILLAWGLYPDSIGGLR